MTENVRDLFSFNSINSVPSLNSAVVFSLVSSLRAAFLFQHQADTQHWSFFPKIRSSRISGWALVMTEVEENGHSGLDAPGP